MPSTINTPRPSQLELDLDLALQSHRALFTTLHSEVRQSRLDCERVRESLGARRGPVRGGAHYRLPASRLPGASRVRTIEERMTTLPLHCLG